MLLSVIIPVYNVEAYVGQTLESVFDTTARAEDFEVVVVNDGTQDGSMSIVRQFANRPNMTIIEQENQGLSATRMNGLAVAKGDYVWFVDSDDWLVEDGVGKVLRLLENRKEAEVLMFPVIWINITTSSKRQDYSIDQEGLLSGGKEVFDMHLPMQGVFRYIIKRDLFDNQWIVFPTGLLLEDVYFGPVLMYLVNSVYVLTDAVYLYREKRAGSIMNTLTRRFLYDSVTIHKMMIRFMEEEVKEDDREWFQEYSFCRLADCYSDYYAFSKTNDFNRLAFSDGLYIWRQWLSMHPTESTKRKMGRLFYFTFPGLRKKLMNQ
jgi:glycosyltransferase involved in cell wall biosynthesis